MPNHHQQEEGDHPFHGILSKPFAESARRFLPHQETVCVPGNAAVRTCLQAMDKAHLRSCMICLETNAGDGATCVASSPRMGIPCCMQVKLPQFRQNSRPPEQLICERFKMLDMRDILKVLITQGQEIFDRLDFELPRSRYSSEDDYEQARNMRTIDGVDTDRAIRAAASTQECTSIIQTILSEPAGAIANISGKNRFRPCWVDDSLENLIKAFDTSPRVPLFHWDESNKILQLVRIFSATDLFALFNNSDFIPNMDQYSNQAFSQILNEPVIHLWNQSQNELQVALDSDPLIDTMRRLVQTGFTALPIVDRTSPRKTLGVISVRDFKQLLLKTDHLDSILSLSTLSYVAQVRQLECLKAKFPSISVNQETPLRAVVQKMLAADIQRIFLVDDKSHISGIFSRTDLGRLVANTINSILQQSTSSSAELSPIPK